MTTANRIDELRKKFEENPRRYFAPLANEYRKTGDVAQAITLCREHLPKQPGHMSGYIVFGQALFESGELPEARTVFEQALALDPENLIALRHLGDIARANNDGASARRWYERVLDADPRNDDIAAQLATLANGRTPSVVAAVIEPQHGDTPAEPHTYADSFARSLETPPLPMTAVGLGSSPTPDSVMRAVDLNALIPRVAQRTPIDLDATDDAGADDVFGFADEASSVSADENHDAPEDAPFEEGLVAASWPDTTEMLSRLVTPRSLTPRSLTPRTTTPYSQSAIDDAAAAFGREADDPRARTTPSHYDVFATTASPHVDAVVGEAPVDDMLVGEAPVGEAPVDDMLVGEAPVEEAPVDDMLVGEEVVGEVAVNEALVDEMSSEAFIHEAPSAEIVSAEDIEFEMSDVVVSEDITVDSEFLDPTLEPSLEEIAEAFEDDARAAGEHADNTFVTQTMGELLVSQGFVARAVDVYQELVRRHPFDELIAHRLTELYAMIPPVEHTQRSEPDVATDTQLFEATTSEFAAPTPAYSTPLSTPFHSPRTTPYSQPAEVAVSASRRSAREWFAELATRRVPRRTPAIAAVAVVEEADGLATLFGSDASEHDDAAARALANAFAPISAQELAAGSTLDFDFARATPSFTRALTPAMPTVATTTPPLNAGFSFDQFFPDPANQPSSAAAPSTSPEAPVTEDLAQFSAWLKGLGSS